MAAFYYRSVLNSGANSSSATQYQNTETTATVDATVVNHTPVANATAGINAGITADGRQHPISSHYTARKENQKEEVKISI